MSQKNEKMFRRVTNTPREKRELKRIWAEITPRARYVFRQLYQQNQVMRSQLRTLTGPKK